MLSVFSDSIAPVGWAAPTMSGIARPTIWFRLVRFRPLHGAPEQLAQCGQRAGVEHVFLFQPAAPRLPDSKFKVGEVEYAVRIRVYADQHAFLPRALALAVEQVEAFRVGVQFEEAAALFRMADDAQHVHVVGFAPFDQAAAGMGE